MHRLLFTPWRYRYITRDKTGDVGCFLCAAARDPDDPQFLVVHRSDHHLVLLNRHPYNSGHLMVAPLVHCGSPTEQEGVARDEFWPVVVAAQRVVERAYAPDGINLGVNLGAAAGAGVPAHFHLHLVPRWHGDSNFLAVVGDTRLIPEELETAREKLRRLFAEAPGGSE